MKTDAEILKQLAGNYGTDRAMLAPRTEAEETFAVRKERARVMGLKALREEKERRLHAGKL